MSQSSKFYSFTCRTPSLETKSISFQESDVFFFNLNVPSFFPKSRPCFGLFALFSEVSDKYTASVFRATELFQVNVDVMG